MSGAATARVVNNVVAFIGEGGTLASNSNNVDGGRPGTQNFKPCVH